MAEPGTTVIEGVALRRSGVGRNATTLLLSGSGLLCCEVHEAHERRERRLVQPFEVGVRVNVLSVRPTVGSALDGVLVRRE